MIEMNASNSLFLTLPKCVRPAGGVSAPANNDLFYYCLVA